MAGIQKGKDLVDITVTEDKLSADVQEKLNREAEPIANLTFSGFQDFVYDGSVPRTVFVPEVPLYRSYVMLGITGQLSDDTGYVSNTLTPTRNQDNAIIGTNITFLPDSATIVLAGLFNTLTIGVKCEFLRGGILIDTKYGCVNRTNRPQTLHFETRQNVSTIDSYTVRITVDIPATGSISIPTATQYGSNILYCI